MGNLPVLDYDLRDLAEIRASLREQLGAFQLAIGELSTAISSSQRDLEFEKEVANLYQTRIVPPRPPKPSSSARSTSYSHEGAAQELLTCACPTAPGTPPRTPPGTPPDSSVALVAR